MAEALASSYLSNPSDPSMLTTRQIKDEWGSFSNFMVCYGLNPSKHDDCEEAAAISRSLAEARNEEKNSSANTK